MTTRDTGASDAEGALARAMNETWPADTVFVDDTVIWRQFAPLVLAALSADGWRVERPLDVALITEALFEARIGVPKDTPYLAGLLLPVIERLRADDTPLFVPSALLGGPDATDPSWVAEDDPAARYAEDQGLAPTPGDDT